MVGAAIVSLDYNAELTVVGRFGSQSITDSIAALKQEVEVATRQKHEESIRVIKYLDNISLVALIPSPPSAATAGAICLFFEDQADLAEIDHETQLLLSFACELYCSPYWSYQNTSTRVKRHSLDGDEIKSLTQRQILVLELIADGKTNERIAKILNYSVATIKNDISMIFRFFNVDDRNQAVSEAINRGILQGSQNTKQSA
jgi:DNA-binding CsgD family transcriptional regulator